MRTYFFELVDLLLTGLQGQELLLCNYAGEVSDFVRFNNSRLRQAGAARQSSVSLRLIDGDRQAEAELTLSGALDHDRARATATLRELRALLPQLPADPHLSYAQTINSTEQLGADRLPPAEQALEAILAAGQGRDLVGIYAAGGVFRGFANSLGQRNWFSSHTFNLDWSFYHRGDRAVKSGYAGFVWDEAELATRADTAAKHLELLARPPRTIEPGAHRAYLAPAAIYEILMLLAWGSFGAKAHRTRQTPLVKMITEEARLSPKVTIAENSAEGVAANFDRLGHVKPDGVTLVDGGVYQDCLISARSAAEYGLISNGASGGEMPESFDMAAGRLPRDGALAALDTGIYVGNLWYLNYSDRKDCRITGMTRFATFWVEGGELRAPLSVMRFDDSIYRMLGSQLLQLTAERELIFDPETYGQRSVGSVRLPGALLGELRLTL